MIFTVSHIIRGIPYFCILVVGMAACLIAGAVYFSYRWTKLSIYNNSFYIQAWHYDIEELKQWMDENISGRMCIEEDIRNEEDWNNGYDRKILMGWTVRFIDDTDAMAFKLMWITKNG